MEWQPIETAPKDGTHILAAVAGASIPCVAKWVVTPRGGKFVTGDEEDFETLDDWAGHVGYSVFPATHWMPLPAPPQP